MNNPRDWQGRFRRKSRRAWPPWHPSAGLLFCGSECPYSHMDDGSHSDGWRDGDWCAWCGDKQDPAPLASRSNLTPGGGAT